MLLTLAQSKGEGVLGIQGDAGLGKSTIGKDVAEALGGRMYETSNVFRGFTVWALKQGMDCANAEALAVLAEEFTFKNADGRIVVNGLDVTNELRGPEVERWVHSVAHVQAVRQAYVNAMHEWIHMRPAVVVGRHIREVFPEAQLVLEIVRHDGVTHRSALEQGSHAEVSGLIERSTKDRETGKRVLAHLTEVQYEVLDTTGMSKIQQAETALMVARRYGF